MKVPEMRRRAAIAIVLGRRLIEGDAETTIDTAQLLAAAEVQQPRPGRWYEGEVLVVGEPGGKRTFIVDDLRKTRGDGRMLSQVDTDALIAIAIHRAILPLGLDAMQKLWNQLPWPRWPVDQSCEAALWFATDQRGGVSSVLVARAMASALWGDRDVGISRATYDARLRG